MLNLPHRGGQPRPPRAQLHPHQVVKLWALAALTALWLVLLFTHQHPAG